MFQIDAIREAYINAIIHNDWSTKTGPSIFLFNNHLEIFSYGSPLKVQSKKDFLKSKSKPINPDLTNVFMKFDKYEASGKGVSTILQSYSDEVFEFGDNDDNFTVSIPYNPLAINETTQHNLSEILSENLSEKEKLILEAIINNNYIKADELASRYRLTRQTINYYIKKLKDKSLIERVDGDKGGH